MTKVPPPGNNPGGNNINPTPGGSTFYVQPQFDQRIRTFQLPYGMGNYGQLDRGYMVWDQPPSGYSAKQLAQVNFLYNPTTLGTSYSMMDNAASTALQWRNASDDASFKVPYNQSTSFSLLYDRTYELWGAYNKNGAPQGNNINDPTVSGVGVDVLAMKQFTGMLSVNPNGTGNGVPTSNITLQGPELVCYAWVFMGPPSGVNYYGYVTDWNVEYTHFTQYMVPMRCVINVDFQLLPPPKKGVNPRYGNDWWSLIGIGGSGTTPNTTTPNGNAPNPGGTLTQSPSGKGGR